MPRTDAVAYRIEFKRSALRDFLRLETRIRERIAEALEWLAAHPRSTVLDVKKLNAPVPVFRLRVGEYRVVYERIDQRMVIMVVRVAHRSWVYRGL
jgi:mRNA interferase RelE/StbE